MWASFSFFTFVLPEMKGHSLEQLDFLFNNRVPTRKFKAYIFADSVPAMRYKEPMDVGEGGSLDKRPQPEVG